MEMANKNTWHNTLFGDGNHYIIMAYNIKTNYIGIYGIRKERRKKQQLYAKKRAGKSKTVMRNLKINGCAICGYNKCDAALSFHHTDPKDKKFNISTRTLCLKESRIVNELNKCILLCCRCHREIHAKEIKINEL